MYLLDPKVIVVSSIFCTENRGLEELPSTEPEVIGVPILETAAAPRRCKTDYNRHAEKSVRFGLVRRRSPMKKMERRTKEEEDAANRMKKKEEKDGERREERRNDGWEKRRKSR